MLDRLEPLSMGHSATSQGAARTDVNPIAGATLPGALTAVSKAALHHIEEVKRAVSIIETYVSPPLNCSTPYLLAPIAAAREALMRLSHFCFHDRYLRPGATFPDLDGVLAGRHTDLTLWIYHHIAGLRQATVPAGNNLPTAQQQNDDHRRDSSPPQCRQERSRSGSVAAPRRMNAGADVTEELCVLSASQANIDRFNEKCPPFSRGK
jgi:hypothetical protein